MDKKYLVVGVSQYPYPDVDAVDVHGVVGVFEDIEEAAKFCRSWQNIHHKKAYVQTMNPDKGLVVLLGTWGN